MATKSILINFAGYYPREIFNLAPDNGLANLASVLISQGHTTQIWDYSTVDSIRRFYPYEYASKVEGVQGEILNKMKRGASISQKELAQLHSLEDEISAWQQEMARILGREISEYVTKNSIDFVGFKLWTGEGFEGAMIIAEEVRKANPDVRVFGGGPHVDLFMEEIFKVTNIFDALAYGEGEETINLLADYVEGKTTLSEIPNLIYRSNGKVTVTPTKRIEDLNSLPFPCYDENVYLAMKGDQKIKIVLLDESRGCPNSCNFCIHPIKSGRRMRTVDAKVFVDRLEEMIRVHGISAFRLAGSNPPAGLRKEIAKEIIRRGLNVKYSAFAHVKGSCHEDFRLLRESGCRALAFGVESGSQEILDKIMNKKVTVSQIKRALKACKESGIATIASLIVPAPTETEQTKRETLNLILETVPDGVNVFFPALLRDSEWSNNKDKYHFQVGDEEAFNREAMTFKGVLWSPPTLWRPPRDYKLDGKTFNEIANETTQFAQIMEKSGFTTRIYDQVFLFAEYMGMPPSSFMKVSASLIRKGDYQKLGEMVAEINKNVLISSVLSS